ncbi:MAG: hypothetical protein LIO74_08525 [Ruminococcus sp.]|nr:hypothetical protein [Ruminococcus sp.]
MEIRSPHPFRIDLTSRETRSVDYVLVVPSLESILVSRIVLKVPQYGQEFLHAEDSSDNKMINVNKPHTHTSSPMKKLSSDAIATAIVIPPPIILVK